MRHREVEDMKRHFVTAVEAVLILCGYFAAVEVLHALLTK